MIRFLTAGESHGPALTAIIEGFPSRLLIEAAAIQADLDRRRKGYGRGGRMKIENDQVTILSGVRHGYTLGSPITLQIQNKDWERWQEIMSAEPVAPRETVTIAGDERLGEIKARVSKARPGHADLAGALKYNQRDLRNILERASARETAARVAVGAVARQLLKEFGITVVSGVLRIGKVAVTKAPPDLESYRQNVNDSPVAAPDPFVTEEMKAEIDRAKQAGDSLGGIIEVIIDGAPVGLGSHVHWERRLDSQLAGALMSIPAIKGVSIGLGFEAAGLPGSAVHDEVYYDPERGFYRKTNNAGGIEGGISNGEQIRVKLSMKPIPTLYNPLQTVEIDTKLPATASVERSDACAVPAAAVVAEAVCCWVIAAALLEKFGGDSMDDLRKSYQSYLARLSQF